ncbi:MAG: NUDIX hydrolase [Chloroflexi bacterium AL-W]|nr:NUDIX hydrolase [Chloroflexi bacterium AL-N1]NOK70196.1 NUDIX hydrolase [Chloroflexi bacterium AL-N10]NOK77733.1 NUDIX hydrolase [Chloroflexi bacterium AL-N5]NOK84742.1 NUDIX hydrolase [Chloroflexi bacterium AL-W]NOK93195.1 NUDIX hydrolase [Chloroflexi bacterium AL-N15]
MLPTHIETEIAELATRYGEPLRTVAQLGGQPISPITKNDRIGEVCMVVRRPNGKLITATKTFYPPNGFRLLTGGIDHGETIEAALLRETFEETGLAIVVRQFLAIVAYHTAWDVDADSIDDSKKRHSATRATPFTTYAFLLDEIGGTLAPQDEKERLGEFREVAIEELPAMANTLDHIVDGQSEEIAGSWRDWGAFRAIIHRVVYDALVKHTL